MSAPIFLSFASKDRDVAQTICRAIENRGITCWISSRDVEPGDSFQVSIVRAIRSAKVMLLVFSANANNSEEVKKELVLASQSKLVVIPVRVEDVTPDEAFAYEFATRQWYDLFNDWERSIEHLVARLARVLEPHPPAPNPASDQTSYETQVKAVDERGLESDAAIGRTSASNGTLEEATPTPNAATRQQPVRAYAGGPPYVENEIGQSRVSPAQGVSELDSSQRASRSQQGAAGAPAAKLGRSSAAKVPAVWVPGVRIVRLAGIIGAVGGIAVLLFSIVRADMVFWEGGILTHALLLFALGAANIFVGLGMAQLQPRIRNPGLAVCILEVVLYLSLLGYVVIDSLLGLSRSIPIHSEDIIVGTILAGGVIMYSPIAVVLFRWRLNWNEPAKWNLLEATAILLLFRGLFGLWVFGSVAVTNPHEGLIAVLQVAPWLSVELPFSLVMIFMSVAIVVGSQRLAPRGIMVAVCALSAILYACDLAWYPDEWWEYQLLDAIGILANLGIIALLSYSYLRGRADS